MNELTDHQIWELLKLQDADAWKLVWERAVLPESRGLRSGSKARDWGISAEELMSMLYVEMIGAGKISLYRDDGGSIWGWLRTYVRGYVNRAKPDERVVFIEGVTVSGGEDEGRERSFEEKLSKLVSDSCGRDTLSVEDPAVLRREEWELVQKCFGDLWRRNPIRAYVHLLKTRMNLSSAQIKSMLAMTSEANVDQTFSRAIKDMRKLKVEHEDGE